MLKISKKISALTETQLHWLFTALSALLAWRVIYIQHGWVNDDSVLYFEVARLFSIGEWKQGIVLFNWPLYPILISTIHQLTHLEIQTSAQLLNVIFFGITTYSYIRLIRLAGGNKATILCGGFLLLSSPYIVGDVLPMLLRDQGFWAMFLSGLVYFIQFYRNKKLSDALLWQICAILAVLFRIEAITFLVGMPLILLQHGEFTIKQKLKLFFQVNLISVFALFLISGVLIILPSVHLSDFGRLQEVVMIFPRMLADISQSFHAKANIMSEKVLGNFFDDYGMMGLITSLASITIFKIISLVGWPVAGIFVWSYTNRPPSQTIQSDTRHIFRWACALALLNACMIIASAFILSGRYIIALAFILLIFAAFHLASFAEKIHNNQINERWHKVLFFILVALITLFAIKNVLPKRSGYNFEQDAVVYIKKLQKPNDRVFYVSPRTRFYAGEPFSSRGYDFEEYTAKAIANGSIQHYDYLAINITSNPEQEKKLKATLVNYQLIKEIMGPRSKKKVMIFAKKE
jgi:hypothetical protein